MGLIVLKKTKTFSFIFLKGKEHKIVTDRPDLAEIEGLVKEHDITKDLNRQKEIEDILIEKVKSPIRASFEKDPRFSYDSIGNIYLGGVSEALPYQIASMVIDSIESGITDIEYIVNFWKLLSLNPDKAVRDQLFSFLEHNGHPITEHGYFLTYKSVAVKPKYDKKTGKVVEDIEYDEETGFPVERPASSDMVFKPHHSGPHGNKIQIGVPVTMPREECDSDPNRTCSSGLHVGSMAYVKDFGHSEKVILECLVNPRNVVAVPSDYNNTKMRVCEYYPISISNGENLSIYLASDYKNYEKTEIEKEINASIKARQIVIDQAVALDKERLDILNSLY